MHEYHLVRGGDHGGPTMHPRMRAMFGWVGAAMSELRSPLAEGPLPCSLSAAAPTSKEFLRVLRAQLEPVREQAAESDETTRRRFGVLPNR